MKRLLGMASLGLAIILFLYGAALVWERTNPSRMSVLPVNEPARIQGQPDSITIPSANIDLPIFPAKLNGVRWDQTTKGVSYWVASPVPGNAGNSVLYGHNWRNLLGPLTKVKPGDKVIVSYGSEQVTFVVHFVTTVDPSNISILAPTSDTRITLYTCTGFLDSKRLVVTAIREDAPSLRS
jgi:LPXTG-site transpeptidase (sortase) family protein